MTKTAINPTQSGITVRNVIVEKYATPFFSGALGGASPASNFVVEDSEVRLNHGGGIVVGLNGIVRGSYIHHNGKLN